MYAIAAWIINYSLFPSLYYKKRYVLFIVCVFIIFNVVILMEEIVIEALLFPDNDGYVFPGYFNTLFEFVPLVLLIVGAKFAWDYHAKQRELDTLKTEIKYSELQFLKSQINPHFLFNNLNNLYAFALEGSPKTTKIILELSNVLRYVLYECEDDFVLLINEIEHLKSYVSLNELQLEERGTVRFEIVSVNKLFKIAPLLLMVFIENAFKHSLYSQTDGISIAISIDTTEQGFLTFNCKNSFSEQKNTKDLPTGIGLLNVRKRLELLYPDKYALSIACKNELYCVNLKLQLRDE